MTTSLKNNSFLKFGLLFILILSLLIPAGIGVSAAQIAPSPITTNTVDNVSPTAIYSDYVTIYKRTTTFPSQSILHSQRINGFEYSGRLNLFDYAYDPDAGLYFATYKGWIYAD